MYQKDDCWRLRVRINTVLRQDLPFPVISAPYSTPTRRTVFYGGGGFTILRDSVPPPGADSTTDCQWVILLRVQFFLGRLWLCFLAVNADHSGSISVRELGEWWYFRSPVRRTKC
jgi:hypothetical protein